MMSRGPEAEYWDHLADGRFMLQYNKSSACFFAYPRVADPAIGDGELEWREASGRGVVHSVTIVRPRPHLEPYTVALIDLAEGPRMMSTVDGILPERVRIGMAVTARIEPRDGRNIVVFEPAG